MMSPLREQKMRRFFNIYDANQSGTIKKSDFEQPVEFGAQMLGYQAGSPEFQEMHKWSLSFWHYLRDNLGKTDADLIAIDEFLKAMDDLVSDKDSLNDIIMGHANFTLKLWDQDKDGMMNESEFIAVHTAYNTKEEDARKAFVKLDRNGDSFLSHSEITMAIEEYFVSDDPEAIGNWFLVDNEN